MSRISNTLAQVRHQLAVTYGGVGGDEFARNAATSVAMSAALDAVPALLGDPGEPADVEGLRASGERVPPELEQGLRALGAMAGMPNLHLDYRDRAETVFWRQLGTVSAHRAVAVEAIRPMA